MNTTRKLCPIKARRTLRSFMASESGMTLPMLGLAFMTVTGFVGSAVDIGRYQLVQSRLSYALDAAGLAAGATMNTTNLDAEVTKFLNLNYPTNYLGSTTPTVTSAVSSDNMVIDLTAATTVPTTFMNVLGISSMSVATHAQITRTASGLELVLALDNTGSMSSSGKLTALKSAATSLVNILYGSKTTVPNLWIGLVPFSQAVNIGTGYTTWIDQTNFATLNWGPTTWSGCVEAREASSMDVTDDTPATKPFKAYYAPSTDNRPYPYNTSSYTSANKWVTARYSDGSPKTYSTSIGETLGPNAYCPQVLTPMTANKTTILNGIASMAARGNTHIGLGAAWAWRMLSPKWRGLWGGEMNTNALPLDYGTKHMNKAVIILTDGENTMNATTFTAYGFLSDARLGSTNATTAETSLDTRLTSVCTSMKNKGIYVYTIALGNPGTNIQNLLKNCASSANYYFNSPTSSQLQSVFNAIADSLSNLRVSE